MKIISKIVAATMLMALLIFPSCKKDPSLEEEFLKKIAGEWEASSTGVTLDDVPVNGAFAGFSITITDQSSFTTQNGNNPIWAASGTFTLKANSTATMFNLVRNDGIEVAVTQLDDTKLILEFQYTGVPGRASSVSGNYVFDLERN